MTTVVAVETADGVWLAADRQTTYGERRGSVSKVLERPGLLIGCAGNLRVANLLEFAKLPKPKKVTSAEETRAFVISKLVPAMIEATAPARERDEDVTSNLLVCVAGFCFEIDPDWTVTRDQRGYCAVGSGSSYALGFLRARLVSHKGGVAGVMAIKAVSEFDVFTGPEVDTYYQGRVLR